MKKKLVFLWAILFGFLTGSFQAIGQERPYGGGNATGVKIEPIGFLVIKDGIIRMINVTPPASTTVDRIIDLVPQVMDRIDNFIEKQKNAD